ncbi:uncharacterized protein MYCFIDRAFT_212178 [Pseudocercospora fijiensis CIRAD86]|uniref:Uncharacterized protein n=1 Tax=Pseudocercospora fijiensis (strain CIRAD86) TaxID=383855 RepID=M2YNJ4_PSEFD|nr:uncharacterized protein MYCFIDRAFT_212178 [Pseudocercospora fijiensis CIRAD86]EME79265.1 hypothetical protein MYCFIDRAFT_212178 [Pseudocercospora fijiensis CIRAD86]
MAYNHSISNASSPALENLHFPRCISPILPLISSWPASRKPDPCQMPQFVFKLPKTVSSST